MAASRSAAKHAEPVRLKFNVSVAGGEPPRANLPFRPASNSRSGPIPMPHKLNAAAFSCAPEPASPIRALGKARQSDAPVATIKARHCALDKRV